MDASKRSANIPERVRNRTSGEIRFDLNSAEAKWLDQQRESFSEALVEILTSALWEWIVRNPHRFVDCANATDILRTALDEFISRHKGEFVYPSQWHGQRRVDRCDTRR